MGPDHAPLFHVVVSLDGGADAQGLGTSKRDAPNAKQRKKLLKQLQSDM
jgi:dsRNA-specific ribonuclease